MKQPNLYPIKHVAAIALEVYQSKFPSSREASSLGVENPNEYLGNRLDLAFLQGWSAAESHYRHQMELKSK